MVIAVLIILSLLITLYVAGVVFFANYGWDDADEVIAEANDGDVIYHRKFKGSIVIPRDKSITIYNCTFVSGNWWKRGRSEMHKRFYAKLNSRHFSNRYGHEAR